MITAISPYRVEGLSIQFRLLAFIFHDMDALFRLGFQYDLPFVYSDRSVGQKTFSLDFAFVSFWSSASRWQFGCFPVGAGEIVALGFILLTLKPQWGFY